VGAYPVGLSSLLELQATAVSRPQAKSATERRWDRSIAGAF